MNQGLQKEANGEEGQNRSNEKGTQSEGKEHSMAERVRVTENR